MDIYGIYTICRLIPTHQPMDFFFSLFMEIIIAEDFSPDVSVAFAGKGVV